MWWVRLCLTLEMTRCRLSRGFVEVQICYASFFQTTLWGWCRESRFELKFYWIDRWITDKLVQKGIRAEILICSSPGTGVRGGEGHLMLFWLSAGSFGVSYAPLAYCLTHILRWTNSFHAKPVMCPSPWRLLGRLQTIRSTRQLRHRNPTEPAVSGWTTQEAGGRGHNVWVQKKDK